MSAEDAPSPSPESSGVQPELLAGASPETAVLLTPEQLAKFRGKLFYVATEVDETLVKQAEEVLAAGEAQPGTALSLWVRAEEPKDIDFGTLFNTWKLIVDERRTDFGRPASNRYYMTHPDGRVEFAYEMRPIA